MRIASNGKWGFCLQHVADESENQDEEKKAQLRVIEEDVPSEEVMRLDGAGKAPKEIARIALPQVPEAAERLESEGLEDIGRRTLEPDIDAILDGEEFEENLEQKWAAEAERKPVPYGWFVLILLVLAGLVISMIVNSHESPGQEQVEQARQASVESEEDDAEEDLEALALVERIEGTMRDFLAADSIDKLLPLVRDPERVEPLMGKWYAKNSFAESEFVRLKVFQPLDLVGRSFWLLTCGLKGEPDISALVEQWPDGSVRVDWETQVCYQPMPWDQYVAERPDKEAMNFRVHMKPDFDALYSHEFAEEERWMGFVLTAKGSDEYLIGYVERGSALGDQLLEAARAVRGRTMAFYLRLRVPEGAASPRGVLIEGVVSDRWALIEPLE